MTYYAHSEIVNTWISSTYSRGQLSAPGTSGREVRIPMEIQYHDETLKGGFTQWAAMSKFKRYLRIFDFFSESKVNLSIQFIDQSDALGAQNPSAAAQHPADPLADRIIHLTSLRSGMKRRRVVLKIGYNSAENQRRGRCHAA